MIIFYKTIEPYNFPLAEAFNKPKEINSIQQIRLILMVIA